MTRWRFVLSGCSGGGKSTLLAALQARGHAVVAEPGRRIIATGGPMPWDDAAGFAARAARMARADHAAAQPGITFFDRSLLDALAWFDRTGTPRPPEIEGAERQVRYASPVFLVPPWPEIHVTDAARRHGFDDAVAEYEALLALLPGYGYRIEVVPRMDVAARCDWIEDRAKMITGEVRE